MTRSMGFSAAAEKGFLMADVDGSGKIDEEEFRAIFKGCQGVTETGIREIWKEMDANEDNTVTCDEFVAWLAVKDNRDRFPFQIPDPADVVESVRTRKGMVAESACACSYILS